MDNGLKLVYESMLITEMEDRVVQYIQDHEEQILPFDDIFGDYMRLVLPLVGSDVVDEIISSVKLIKDFEGYDSSTNEVVRKIKLNPKYGGGTKEQRISLGRALQSLKIDPEKKKKLLNWYAKYKDSLQNIDLQGFNEEQEYAIILSRAPVDIVRMSDYGNVTSCHRAGGDYFHCAIQEAIAGGAIAYLVKFDALKDYLENDQFQNADLFNDSDRNIRGLQSPLARLRVRRIEKKNGEEIAIPETRIYGDTSIPDFYSSLRDFLQTKQKLDLDEVHTDVWNGEYKVRGGTYHDNDLDTLLDKYFDLDNDSEKTFSDSNIRHSYDDDRMEDEHRQMDNHLEEDLQKVHQEFEPKFTQVSGWYDMDHDSDQPSYMMGGSVSFDLSKLDVSETFENDVPDEGDFDNTKDEDDAWGVFSNGLESSDLDYGRLKIRGYMATPKELIVYFDNSYTTCSDDTDDYWNFLDNLDDLQKNYDEAMENIINLLSECGFISQPVQSEYTRINQLQQTSRQDLDWWDNIDITGSNKKTYQLSFGEITLLPDKKKRVDIDYSIDKDLIRLLTVNDFVYKVQSTLNNMLKDIYKIPQKPDDSKQLKFSNFFESVEDNSTLTSFGVNMKLTINWNHDIALASFNLKPMAFKDVNFEVFDYIDSIYSTIVNLVRTVVYNKMLTVWHMSDIKYTEYLRRFEPSNYQQMLMAFRKYF